MLCMAQVYKYLGREMKWLWTKDLKQNTVHVKDAARALWESAEWYVKGKKNWDEATMGKTPIFNVVDHTGTGTYFCHFQDGEVYLRKEDKEKGEEKDANGT
jgi:hypothetical protein